MNRVMTMTEQRGFVAIGLHDCLFEILDRQVFGVAGPSEESWRTLDLRSNYQPDLLYGRLEREEVILTSHLLAHCSPLCRFIGAPALMALLLNRVHLGTNNRAR